MGDTWRQPKSLTPRLASRGDGAADESYVLYHGAHHDDVPGIMASGLRGDPGQPTVTTSREGAELYGQKRDWTAPKVLEIHVPRSQAARYLDEGHEGTPVEGTVHALRATLPPAFIRAVHEASRPPKTAAHGSSYGWDDDETYALNHPESEVEPPSASEEYWNPPHLYHGTSVELRPGDMAEGGYPSNFDKPKGRLDHGYATPHVSTAAGYAETAAQRRGGRPRVYEVDRAHDMLPDPETGAAFGISSESYKHPGWRSKSGFRVLRELHPSEFEHHLTEDWPGLGEHTAVVTSRQAAQVKPLPVEEGLYYRAHHKDAPFGREHASTQNIGEPPSPDMAKYWEPKPGYSAFWSPHHLHQYHAEMGWDSPEEMKGRRVLAFRGTPIGEGADGEPRVMPHSDKPEGSMSWGHFRKRLEVTPEEPTRWDDHTWGQGPHGQMVDDGYRTLGGHLASTKPVFYKGENSRGVLGERGSVTGSRSVPPVEREDQEVEDGTTAVRPGVLGGPVPGNPRGGVHSGERTSSAGGHASDAQVRLPAVLQQRAPDRGDARRELPRYEGEGPRSGPERRAQGADPLSQGSRVHGREYLLVEGDKGLPEVRSGPEHPRISSTYTKEQEPAGTAQEAARAGAELEGNRRQALAVAWTPSVGIFGPTTGLDPLLFDGAAMLRPQVRHDLMTRLDQCLRVDSGLAGSDWQEWLHVYLAGGSASEWAGSRPNEAAQDLDVIVAVNLAGAQGCNAFEGMNGGEAASALNAAFWRHFNADGWRPGFGGTWNLTAFCNQRAQGGIEAIKPYAAYDVTGMRWAVSPPHLPEHTIADFSPAVTQMARAVAAEARAILRMDEPLRTREARALWDRVHADRSAAFGDQGGGWQDAGNLVEKWLAYAPHGLLGKIRDLAMAKTAAYTPASASGYGASRPRGGFGKGREHWSQPPEQRTGRPGEHMYRFQSAEFHDQTMREGIAPRQSAGHLPDDPDQTVYMTSDDHVFHASPGAGHPGTPEWLRSHGDNEYHRHYKIDVSGLPLVEDRTYTNPETGQKRAWMATEHIGPERIRSHLPGSEHGVTYDMPDGSKQEWKPPVEPKTAAAQQNPPCRYCGEPIDDEDAEEGHDSHAECQQMAWCEAHQDYHDNPVEAEQHNDTHTEWSFHLPFRDGIHRGISKQFPAEVHQVIHDKSRPVAERAGFLRNHLNENPSDGMGLQRRLTNEERYGGTGHFGVHWTDSEPHARGWAEDDMYEGPVGSGPKPSVTHVVLHAASPDRDHIEEDPEELERRNMYGFDHQRSEREVPLKVGAPVHLTGISWKRGGEDEWNRHDFGKVAPKTAAWHHDTSGSDHSGVYLRFGDWPHDERSFSPASGYHEEGVSAYDLDRDGDPAIGHGLDRGHREHTDECDVDENGTCQFNDPWGEPDNDPQEEMRGRRTRAERSRYHGSDKPSEVGHLVRGEMSGVGYDGEPLLKNVKRVGDWIDHRHLFLDQAGPHRLARDPSDEDYEAPEEKPPYGYRNRTASLEPQGYWLDHRPPGPGHTSQSGRPQPSVPYHEATGRDPEDLVDVYRGAPEGTDRINQGDWVTLHGDWARDRGPNVLHARVPARHVYLDASERDDDEAGYHGPAITATASRDDEEDPDRYVTCEQGHSHWGALGAAGLLVRHREGDSGPYRYLLQKRSPHVHEGNTWSTPGGALQHGETPEEGAVREAEEEGLRLPAGTRHRHTSTDDHGGWKYSTVIMDAPHQFSPSGQENWESEGHGWFTPQQVRDLPLHPGFAASWDKVRKSAVAEKTAAPAHPWHNWAADQPHKAVIWHAQSRVRDDHPELTSPLPPPDAEGFSAEGHALLKKALTAGGYPPGRAERSFVLAHGAPDDNGTSQVAMIGSRMGIALHPRSWDPGTVAHEAAHLLDIRQHGRDPVQSARVPDEEMHGPEFAGHYATALDAISPGSGDDFLRHHADSMALVGNFRARVHGLPREYPGSEPMQREATTSGGVPQRPKRTPGSAMVYLDVPHGTVEPYEGQEGGHHVALAYLPRSIGDEDFERVKQRAREAATRHAPMKATAGGGEVFPPGTPSDRRRVAVVPVHAPGIHELHDEFSEFDRAHYDTYTPHVTRAQLGGHQVNPPPHPEASFPVTHVHVRRGDEVHSFPLTGPSQREAATGAAYYHGTRYNLNPGDVLEGGAKPANNPGAGRYEHVYMARTPSAAHAAGSLSYDEHGHRRNQPNVYEVEPLDAPERDPYTTGAVRSKRARVVRQVDPVNPPCSRCGKPLADDDMEYGASEHLGCEQQQKTAAAEHEVLYHSGGRDFPGDEEWVHLGTRTAAFNRAKDWNLERERRGEPAAPVYLHHVELGGSHYPNERSDNEANDPVWKDIATTHGHNVLPYINEYEDTGTTSYLAHHSAVKLLKTEPLTTEGIDEHWQRQQEYFGNPRHKTAVSGYDPPARSNWRVEMMHPRDLMQHIETYRTDDEGGRRHRQSLAESFRQHGYDPELHGGMSGNKHFSPVSSPITLVHDDEDSYFEEGNHRAHALNDAGWDEHVPVLVKDLRKQAVSGYDGLTGRSGMIYLDLPPGTVRQVPGGVDDHHITLCYLGKDVSDEAFEEACRRTKAAAARLAPMDGVLRGIDIFPPSKGSDGKVVAFVPAYVGSVGLLRRELEDLSASEHADWRPHVTLAYLEEGDSLPAPHPAVPLRFTRVHVKRGDDIRGYPLGGMQREASAEYTVPVHRGVWFGSHEEHPDLLSRLRANPEEALRAAAGGGKWGEGHLGSHWSSSADAARNFALGGFDEEGYPREHPVGVTFHGSVHPDHVMDPRSFEWKKMYLQHQILPSHSHEQEVTVRPGAPVRLHGITVHWGDVNGDEDGSQHHQVDRETPA